MEEAGLRHPYKYHGGGLGPSKGLRAKCVLSSLARGGRLWGTCQPGSGWGHWGARLLSSYFNPSSCLIRGSTWNAEATGHAAQTLGCGWLWVEDCLWAPSTGMKQLPGWGGGQSPGSAKAGFPNHPGLMEKQSPWPVLLPLDCTQWQVEQKGPPAPLWSEMNDPFQGLQSSLNLGSSCVKLLIHLRELS